MDIPLIDKSQLVKLIISKIQQQLDIAIESANSARSTATHSESKAENKYDTFGLEASYLAHGQSSRVEELKITLNRYNELPLSQYDPHEPIGLSSLVSLETRTGELTQVFIGPGAGGIKANVGNQSVLVVTPEAPLGAALMGSELDDEVKLLNSPYNGAIIVDVQ